MEKSKNYEIIEQYNLEEIENIFNNFDTLGESIYSGTRNQVKNFIVNTKNNEKKIITIKAFSKKNFITELYYKYIKSNKSQRSYEYGNMLLKKGIKTPKPIGYFNEINIKTNKKKYNCAYISEYLDYDYDARKIFELNHNLKDKFYKEKFNSLIKEFAKFVYKLHEKGIKFNDLSGGNVLIKEKSDGYDFYLIDLNRTEFKKQLSFKERMENLKRMLINEDYIDIFANYYNEYYKNEPLEKIKKYLKKYVRQHKIYNKISYYRRKIKNFRLWRK